MTTTTRIQRSVIVGGGAVGSMFVDVLGVAGSQVCVVDLASRTPRVGVDFERADILAPTQRVVDELRRADLVMLALPENVAVAAVGAVAEAMRPGALLVDTSSVKTAICDAILRHAPHLEAVALNPMFAPALEMTGRPIAAVVVHGGPRTDQLFAILAHHGAQLVELAADTHDRLAAAAQVLPHAAILAFGVALAELDVDFEQLMQIAPPPCTTMLALLARILSGVPAVYWEVQETNPYGAATRATLAGAVSRLVSMVERIDQDAFAHALHAAQRAFGRQLPYYRDLCATMFVRLVDTGEPPS
jgi:prephenate dehydrogenase